MVYLDLTVRLARLPPSAFRFNIAHAPSGLYYRRTDLIEHRRRLMGDWANYLADGTRDPNAGPVR